MKRYFGRLKFCLKLGVGVQMAVRVFWLKYGLPELCGRSFGEELREGLYNALSVVDGVVTLDFIKRC